MNRFLSMEDLVQTTIRRLSQVTGVGTQLYAEDRIVDAIQHKFEVVAKDRWWPWLMSWQTFTLDGTTGVATVDISTYVKDQDDIRVLYPADKRIPLTALPTTINPYRITGTDPKHFEYINDAAALFRVWPLTSTGNIRAHLRLIPARYAADAAEVAFDPETLILGAAYDYLIDDGTNPDASNKFEGWFNSRYDQIKTGMTPNILALNDELASSPSVDEWYDAP